jgi:hydroxyacylglutathione hydrolase
MEIFSGLYAFIWQDYTENNCNSYLITGSKTILVDPGHLHLFGHVTRGLNAAKLPLEKVDVVIITHGHPDHMEAIAKFEKPTRLAMNQVEHGFIKKLAGNYIQIPEPDFFIGEGDLTIGEHVFRVLVTPGHTLASISLYWPEKKALFTGDVVFAQGIGRTDLPGGSGKQLKESIKRLAALDVEYLFSGHGNIVTGRKAVQENFRIIEKQWFGYL